MLVRAEHHHQLVIKRLGRRVVPAMTASTVQRLFASDSVHVVPARLAVVLETITGTAAGGVVVPFVEAGEVVIVQEFVSGHPVDLLDAEFARVRDQLARRFGLVQLLADMDALAGWNLIHPDLSATVYLHDFDRALQAARWGRLDGQRGSGDFAIFGRLADGDVLAQYTDLVAHRAEILAVMPTKALRRQVARRLDRFARVVRAGRVQFRVRHELADARYWRKQYVDDRTSSGGPYPLPELSELADRLVDEARPVGERRIVSRRELVALAGAGETVWIHRSLHRGRWEITTRRPAAPQPTPGVDGEAGAVSAGALVGGALLLGAVGAVSGFVLGMPVLTVAGTAMVVSAVLSALRGRAPPVTTASAMAVAWPWRRHGRPAADDVPRGDRRHGAEVGVISLPMAVGASVPVIGLAIGMLPEPVAAVLAAAAVVLVVAVIGFRVVRMARGSPSAGPKSMPRHPAMPASSPMVARIGDVTAGALVGVLGTLAGAALHGWLIGLPLAVVGANVVGAVLAGAALAAVMRVPGAHLARAADVGSGRWSYARMAAGFAAVLVVATLAGHGVGAVVLAAIATVVSVSLAEHFLARFVVEVPRSRTSVSSRTMAYQESVAEFSSFVLVPLGVLLIVFFGGLPWVVSVMAGATAALLYAHRVVGPRPLRAAAFGTSSATAYRWWWGWVTLGRIVEHESLPYGAEDGGYRSRRDADRKAVLKLASSLSAEMSERGDWSFLDEPPVWLAQSAPWAVSYWGDASVEQRLRLAVRLLDFQDRRLLGEPTDVIFGHVLGVVREEIDSDRARLEGTGRQGETVEVRPQDGEHVFEILEELIAWGVPAADRNAVDQLRREWVELASAAVKLRKAIKLVHENALEGFAALANIPIGERFGVDRSLLTLHLAAISGLESEADRTRLLEPLVAAAAGPGASTWLAEWPAGRGERDLALTLVWLISAPTTRHPVEGLLDGLSGEEVSEDRAALVDAWVGLVVELGRWALVAGDALASDDVLQALDGPAERSAARAAQERAAALREATRRIGPAVLANDRWRFAEGWAPEDLVTVALAYDLGGEAMPEAVQVAMLADLRHGRPGPDGDRRVVALVDGLAASGDGRGPPGAYAGLGGRACELGRFQVGRDVGAGAVGGGGRGGFASASTGPGGRAAVGASPAFSAGRCAEPDGAGADGRRIGTAVDGLIAWGG